MNWFLIWSPLNAKKGNRKYQKILILAIVDKEFRFTPCWEFFLLKLEKILSWEDSWSCSIHVCLETWNPALKTSWKLYSTKLENITFKITKYITFLHTWQSKLLHCHSNCSIVLLYRMYDHNHKKRKFFQLKLEKNYVTKGF